MRCETIGDIASVQTGPFGSQLHKDDYVTIGTPIVTVEHLGSKKMTTQNLPQVSESDKKRLSKYLLSDGDLVFSRVGSVDRCSYVGKEEDGWLFSGRCLRVRCDQKKVCSAYVYYYFCLEDTKQMIRNVAVGATMPSINTKLLFSLPFKWRPLPEQKRIADILSALDDKIELNNRMNKNLETQAQAIFKSWFVDFEPWGGVMPEDWREASFTTHISVLGGGTPKTDTTSFWNGKIPFFTPKDANDGCYTIQTEKNITPLGLKACNSRLYNSNTVFVTARGTVGKLSLAGKSMAMNQSCYALVSDKYSQFFVFHLSKTAIEKLKSKANGAVFNALVTRDSDSEYVVFPTPNETKKFDSVVAPIYTNILNNYNQSQTLAALRDTLLPKLMSGEIDVKEVE